MKDKSINVFFNGLVKENPTFVLMLGMCPTLAVTTSAINGLGMGLTTTAVLVLSNVLISLLRNIIPNRVRIPAFIVIVASFVTMAELLLEGFIPSLYSALGIYIPLIVVNCIILGRAESFASKNAVVPSFFDGLGMGLGFTVALTAIGMVRELLGAGELFGIPVINNALAALSSVLGRSEPIVRELLDKSKRLGIPVINNAFAALSSALGRSEPMEYVPVSIFVLAPGAFFVLAALTALQNRVKRKMQEKGQNADKIQSGCSFDCASCEDSGCAHRFVDVNAPAGSVADAAAAKNGKGE